MKTNLQIKGEEKRINCISASSKGRYIAAVLDTNEVRIWNVTNGEEIKIKNVDFTGNEKYKSDLELAIKNSKAIVLVYCLDIFHYNLKDLQKYWIDEIKKKAPKNSIIALVLNKNDSLGKKVLFDERDGRKLAKDNDILFFSTSAKENKGITEIYEGIIKKIKG